MKTKLNHLLIPTAASTSLLMLGGCGDDEDGGNTADLIVGEWELIEVNGEEAGEDDGDYSYSIVFEFQSDGDFSWCEKAEWESDPSKNYEDCYDGEWEWINVGTKLNFKVADDYDIDLTITKLTETTLEGSWEEEDEDDGEIETYEVVFEKL